MKSILLVVCVFVTALFVSCNSTPTTESTIQNARWVVVEAPGFQIEIPDYLNLINAELNPDAIFTYGNDSMEVYTMVIEEDAQSVHAAFMESGETDFQNGLSGYTNFVRKNIVGEAQQATPSREENSGDVHCQYFEIEGADDSLDLYRALRIIESNGKYYQFHTWTLREQKDQYKDIMNKILKSFKPNAAVIPG